MSGDSDICCSRSRTTGISNLDKPRYSSIPVTIDEAGAAAAVRF